MFDEEADIHGMPFLFDEGRKSSDEQYKEMTVSLSQVTDLKSYTTWLNETFVDTYFAQDYFGTEVESELGAIKPFTKDLVNLRIGPARLRQLRIKPGQCQERESVTSH